MLDEWKDFPHDALQTLMMRTNDGPKLAVLYLKHLQQQEKADEAWVYATHLLARWTGEDAIYEFLLQLDEEKALKFIKALRAYDPYEERPLIWLAETALRLTPSARVRQTG